jgi:hypothetical protein
LVTGTVEASEGHGPQGIGAFIFYDISTSGVVGFTFFTTGTGTGTVALALVGTTVFFGTVSFF